MNKTLVSIFIVFGLVLLGLAFFIGILLKENMYLKRKEPIVIYKNDTISNVIEKERQAINHYTTIIKEYKEKLNENITDTNIMPLDSSVIYWANYRKRFAHLFYEAAK